MVSDQEPRYRLVDSNGNVVGTLFAESDGTLKLQEGTSGNENELIFGTDGTVTLAEVETDARVSPQDEKTKWLSTQVTLADDTRTTVKSAFGLSNPRNGHLWVSKATTAGTAQAEIRGRFEQDANLIHSSDGRFTNVAGNDGTVNIVHDGSDYIIENKDGGERLLTLWYLTAP